jgi:hypothetical protein
VAFICIYDDAADDDVDDDDYGNDVYTVYCWKSWWW